jgi:hypothetical protein
LEFKFNQSACTSTQGHLDENELHKTKTTPHEHASRPHEGTQIQTTLQISRDLDAKKWQRQTTHVNPWAS